MLASLFALSLAFVAPPLLALASVLADVAAGPVLPSPDNLEQFIPLVVGAITSGNWMLVAAAVLILVVWVIRKFLLKKLFNGWFQTDLGGTVLVLVTAIAGGIITVFAGGAPFSVALLVSALKMAFTAAGGYTLVKKLLWPLLLLIAQKIGIPTSDAPQGPVLQPVPTTDGDAADVVAGLKGDKKP